MYRLMPILVLVFVTCMFAFLQTSSAQSPSKNQCDELRLELAQSRLDRASLQHKVRDLESQLSATKDAAVLLQRAQSAENELRLAQAAFVRSNKRVIELVAENALLRNMLTEQENEPTALPPPPITQNTVAPPPPPVTQNTVESMITSKFTGKVFDKGNLFELQNGQIWKQTEFKIHYHYAYYPRAIIFREGGIWKMKVEGIEDTVIVERIR